MHGPDGLVTVGNALAQRFDEVAVKLRHRITHRVWHINRRCSLVNHGFKDATQIVNVAAIAVLGTELDIRHQIAGKTHREPGLFQYLLRRHAQLLFHVQRAGGDEGMNTGVAGAFEGFSGARNIAVIGARQRANSGIPDRIGDRLHGLEIAVGACRKSGLDHVHFQTFELACNAQFFIFRHGRAGRLFAIAQGGIKNDQFVGHGKFLVGWSLYCRPQCAMVAATAPCPALLRCRPETIALSDAETILPSMPMPKSVWSLMRSSRYATACALAPEPMACSW